MHDIFKLCDEYNAIGLVTNQVQSNPAVFSLVTRLNLLEEML